MCINNKIVKGQDYMENRKKMYITAEEVDEMLGVYTSYAYKIIGDEWETESKGLSNNLRQNPNKILWKKFYCLTVAM